MYVRINHLTTTVQCGRKLGLHDEQIYNCQFFLVIFTGSIEADRLGYLGKSSIFNRAQAFSWPARGQTSLKEASIPPSLSDFSYKNEFSLRKNL